MMINTNDTFKYLAIGNSITQHGINEYWWDQMGMAATRSDRDYYHIVVSEIDRLCRGV